MSTMQWHETSGIATKVIVIHNHDAQHYTYNPHNHSPLHLHEFWAPTQLSIRKQQHEMQGICVTVLGINAKRVLAVADGV